MAQHWLEQGAERLHIVDLNGAVAGVPKNELAIREIVSVIGEEIPVQLGGGIRDLDTIERYLDDGITLRHHRHGGGQEPGLPARRLLCVSRAHHRRPRRARRQGRDRRLVEDDRPRRRRSREEVRGLRRRGDHLHRHRPRRHADRRQRRGDGRARARAQIPVIASGGIASIDDILNLVPFEKEGIIGAIAGRALYEGKLDFKAAMKAAKGADSGQRLRRSVRCRAKSSRPDSRHGTRQAHHPLPRHRRRPRGQGRQFRQPARRRRSGRGRAPLRRRRAPTSSRSSTSARASRRAACSTT